MNLLGKYALNDRFLNESTLYPEFSLARIISQSKNLYKAVTAEAEIYAEVSGNFRYNTLQLSDYPAVGDFVMVSLGATKESNAIIHNVLTRKSVFARSAVGYNGETQIVAANVDYVFICMALNNDYNLNRLERYLSVAFNSGATPVVVLTKSDLCDDTDIIEREVKSVAIMCDIIFTGKDDLSVKAKLMAYLKAGVTASFIGSSGVGKSTLINLLIGEELLQVNSLRNDDKGRHTTTFRQMFPLPNASVVIDTPGMRELGIEDADLNASFSDIEELSAMCRFSDCTHTSEPGCAVLAAVENGSLDTRRYENYLKLSKEVSYNGLNSRQIENEKINRMFGGKKEMKNKMDYYKKKK